MTVFDVLNFNREVFLRTIKMGVKIDDCRYINLYKDYMEMEDNGEKVSYIVVVLAERYHLCVRTVYAIVKRMKQKCKPL